MADAALMLARSTAKRTDASAILQPNVIRGGQQHQILNAIVGFISIDMMDVLPTIQSSTKGLLHDNAMLQFIGRRTPPKTLWNPDLDIPHLHGALATLPPCVLFASPSLEGATHVVPHTPLRNASSSDTELCSDLPMRPTLPNQTRYLLRDLRGKGNVHG
jgi:hypothetical protein